MITMRTNLWECTLRATFHSASQFRKPGHQQHDLISHSVTYYPDTVITSPCPILLMPSARLSSDKDKLCKSLVWFDLVSNCWPFKWAALYRFRPPSAVFFSGKCMKMQNSFHPSITTPAYLLATNLVPVRVTTSYFTLSAITMDCLSQDRRRVYISTCHITWGIDEHSPILSSTKEASLSTDLASATTAITTYTSPVLNVKTPGFLYQAKDGMAEWVES